jgi:hypothetical protein
MAKAKEKQGSDIIQINIRVNKDLHDKYEACKPDGFSRVHMGRAIIRLWTSLDDETQWKLLMAESFYDRNPAQGAEKFAAVVHALAKLQFEK